MNSDYDKQNDLEKEKTKLKIWLCTISILILVAGIILFIYSIYASIKSLGNDLSMHTFHVVEIDFNNKNEIISILEKENRNYCESMYKIEYESLFPNDYNVKIYCMNEDDISFGVADNEHSNLINHIHDNGIIEKRK